ncbi:MAG: flagellar motor protein MotD [Pseudomonadales bacterium]
MSRRRVVEDPVSHERWLVSYADFITLLFAFFVVMYSISQVNEGKYKVLSEVLSEAFTHKNSAPERNLDPFQVGEIAKSNPRNFIELNASAIKERHGDSEGQGEVAEQGGFPEEFELISSRIDAAFGDLVDENMITVRGNEEWLEVELKSSLLFASGDARLSVPALELLGTIAEILRDQGNPIRVEGFTDNVPINTLLFPSNWELSTARASAVVQLFTEEGLDPSRFAAIGYGEHQPIADNAIVDGRAANRRVVLMISKTGELRPALRELASVEALFEQQRITERAGQTGIKIIIPGVEPVTKLESASPDQAKSGEGTLEGIRTIQLEGGGLLFTGESNE